MQRLLTTAACLRSKSRYNNATTKVSMSTLRPTNAMNVYITSFQTIGLPSPSRQMKQQEATYWKAFQKQLQQNIINTRQMYLHRLSKPIPDIPLSCSDMSKVEYTDQEPQTQNRH